MPGTISPPRTSKETACEQFRHASRHVRHARALMDVRIANPRWRRKCSWHSLRMRNTKFYVSGKRPIILWLNDFMYPPWRPNPEAHLYVFHYPSQVYLGTTADAENLALLRGWHIHYLLNCDGGSYIKFRRLREHYGPESGILGYEEIPVGDTEFDNIKAYFDKAHAFINYARWVTGGMYSECLISNVMSSKLHLMRVSCEKGSICHA